MIDILSVCTISDETAAEISAQMGILLQITTLILMLPLSKLIAPHGKFVSHTTSVSTATAGGGAKEKAPLWWGGMLPGRICWALQEAPAFVVPIYLSVCRGLPSTAGAAVLQVCFLIHYFHRSVTFPLFFMRGSKPTTGLVFICALFFCCWNGLMQGLFFSTAEARGMSETHHGTTSFAIGVVMWAIGFAINVHSDYTLCNLRKPGETGYKIPQGGMFNLVSAANYFGEMIEWSGYALASGFQRAPSAFAFFTVLYLGTRGVQQHKWYQSKFGSKYPKNRKAVFPFLL